MNATLARRLTFALSAIPSLVLAAETSAEIAKPKTVFTSGRGDKYAGIRIPALLATKSGRLLAFAEGRKIATDQGMNDIVLATSDDNGATWSRRRTIAESGKDTFNNACPVQDLKTGDIFVMYQRYPAGVGERSGKLLPGLAAGPATISNHVIVSHDNGATWSKPVDITATTKASDSTLTAGGPNAGVCLTHGAHAGRLAVPFNRSVGFGNWTVAVVISDDHGKTWKLAPDAPSAPGTVNETALAETDSGGLYLNARKWKGSSQRRVTWSADAGESWTPVADDRTLVCTGTQGSVLKYSFSDDKSSGGKSRTLYSGPSVKRTAGKVFLSPDDGKTWSHAKVVVPGEFAYSSLARLPDGSVGLLYEPGGAYRDIRFLKFTLGELTDGADTGK